MAYKFKVISKNDLQVTENNEETLRHPVLEDESQKNLPIFFYFDAKNIARDRLRIVF
jgi:hypothetical protein